MKYEVEWTTRALRGLRKLDRAAARRVLLAVTRLSDDPRPAGVRALVGEPAGTLRLRVGDYRMVYLVDDGRIVVTVVRVGHRREIY
ncbi:type II toxin-antitoxin system RelE family toxin [Frankia sp. CiP1_Cm_nod1]|uniref:type II toxin-antitoxin system RelE family toxin n=1 Tax=Frankia sp. CiP1_Cm_nod1 TaxID=2897160 RepID=UPI004043FCCB